MGKIIKCTKCGHLLATYGDVAGLQRQSEFAKGVRVKVEKNALGEDLGWASCPKCKALTHIDASYLPRTK